MPPHLRASRLHLSSSSVYILASYSYAIACFSSAAFVVHTPLSTPCSALASSLSPLVYTSDGTFFNLVHNHLYYSSMNYMYQVVPF